MTKQEEIREEIAKIIGIVHKDAETTPAQEIRAFNRSKAQKLIEYLHSQDVVIKVDKPLPLPPLDIFNKGVIKLSKTDLDKAGYGAFESLVKT